MKDIICNIPYVLCTLYRGNRLFIFVAINFWYSDYLQNSLMEKNPSVIFWSYSTTMVIASLIGNILGGVVINKIGGTRSKHIYVAMGVLQFICVVFGLCAPFSSSVLIFTILMSIYILVNSASRRLSGQGSPGTGLLFGPRSPKAEGLFSSDAAEPQGAEPENSGQAGQKGLRD